MEKISLAAAGAYLAVMAVIDGRKKEIPVIPGIACIAVIAIVQITAGCRLTEWLPGAGIGLFLFAVSKLSRGGVGEGDALVYAVTGVTLGFARNLELLMISLFLASVAAVVLIIVRRAGRKYVMPFIPFTAVSYGLLLLL